MVVLRCSLDGLNFHLDVCWACAREWVEHHRAFFSVVRFCPVSLVILHHRVDFSLLRFELVIRDMWKLISSFAAHQMI